MKRVLKEAALARKDFDEDAVHDLRTALRRCRSIAVAMQQVDASRDWQAMEQEAKRLLDGMSILRDAQVLHNLRAKFSNRSGPAGQILAEETDRLEHKGERKAGKRLRKFDGKHWREWTDDLPERAAKIPLEGAVMQLLGLEHWSESWDRHRFAMRSRSMVAIHKLRVSVKRLRYFAENFLPERHARWGEQLKRVQDLLGDIHDLDVLWSHLARLRRRISEQERELWRDEIHARRAPLLAEYQEMSKGPDSIWQRWRADLPAAGELDRDRLELLAAWASYFDPHPRHSRQVARLALQIFDGLQAAGLSATGVREPRLLLEAAAIVHDVGLAEGHKHHQRETFKIVSERTPVPGWTKGRMALIAAIARAHRGALPEAAELPASGITSHEVAGVLFLAGILRLAVALTRNPAREIKRVYVAAQPTEVMLRASGYDGAEPMASELAAARHLLETELDRPVMIVPAERASAA